MRVVRLGGVLLAVCVLASHARAAPDELLITVRVTGAVDRTGAYHHAIDNSHLCRPLLEVPPGPQPGSQFLNLPYTIDFDSAARPPAASFRLEVPGFYPGSGGRPAGIFRVAMTAGGHFWQGETPALPGTIETDGSGATGRFHIEGLRSDDAAGTITVQGEWHCPPPR